MWAWAFKRLGISCQKPERTAFPCRNLKPVPRIPNLRKQDNHSNKAKVGFKVGTKILKVPQQITPSKRTWGLQQAESDFEHARFRGYFVLAWSRPSMTSFKMLACMSTPEVLVVASDMAHRRLCIWRYCRTFLMCSLWAFSN